jgi:two-component system, OmpR family, heavy metal sensor histidine kinase CusS
MKPLPSRLKIALLSAGISGVVLVGFGVVMWLLIYQTRISAVDREIRSLGSRHPGLFAGRGSFERLASSLEFTYGEDYTNHIILLIQDAAGRISYRSPHWPEEISPEKIGLPLIIASQSATVNNGGTNVSVTATLIDSSAGRGGGGGRGFGQGRGGPPPAITFTKSPKYFTVKTADSIWRMGVLGNDEVTLIAGLNQQEVEQELNRVSVTFWLTLPVALFLVGLGGWVVAGRALRPLKTIAATAEHFTARGLEQRIPDADDSPEVGRVIQVLNRMMERLETSFRQATRFSADASHELKTPLTVMQGELESALKSAIPGSAEQQLFINLLEETQRLKTITRSLLLLAQADAGQLKLAREPVDLSAELDAMIEDARVLAADARLQFEVELPPQLPVMVDRALLHTALFNLIMNAIKYNETDGRISLKLETLNGQIAFTIGNTGPGIPSEEQTRIFDRFYRGNHASGRRVDGIGLGLSMAREIVRAHGGELSLKEGRSDWTCFALLLPASGNAIGMK